jgi:uncharacterized protein (DUF2147 family)
MARRGLIAGSVAAVLLAAGTATAQAPDRPEGRWISATGNVEVQIAPCGPALCGVVSRVMGNRSMQALTQSKAPPARVGLRIFTNLVPSGPGRWSGHAYNRENGRTYDCVIEPHGRTMTVRAYVVAPLFGKSQVWTRAG